jgi:hypothetical protein
MLALLSWPAAQSASLWALSVLLALLLGCCLIAAQSAQASIVIGQSIARVKLGATKAQVKQAHGQPAQSDADEFVYRGLRVMFKHGRVDLVLSFSNGQKTAQGITVGSSQTQLKSAYPKAKCIDGTGTHRIYLYCVIPGHAQGRQSYTGFLCETGGVVEVNLGFGSVSYALSKP